MRILFERTGGFAGRKIERRIDSAALPVCQAHRLNELLKQSGFFALPAVLKSDNPGADRFSYRVTIETEEGRHTVEAAEEAVPGSMRPLLDFLSRSAHPKP
jgi:hypothetical protein